MIFKKKSIILPLAGCFTSFFLLLSCGGSGAKEDSTVLQVGDILSFDTQGTGGAITVVVGGLNRGSVQYVGTASLAGNTAYSESLIGFAYNENPGFFSISFQVDRDYHIHAGPSIINRVMSVAFSADLEFGDDNIIGNGMLRSGTMNWNLSIAFPGDILPPPPGIEGLTNGDGVFSIRSTN